MIARLARWCFTHRRTVLAFWLIGLVAVVATAVAAGIEFEDNFELPGSESQQALDTLTAGGFDTRSGFEGQIVFAAPGGVHITTITATVNDLLDQITDRVEDVTVISPYDPDGAFQISNDRTIAFATISLADRPDADYTTAIDTIVDLVDQARSPDLQVELGGDRFVDAPEGGGEALGLLAAILILLIAFRSVLAMGLPILTALLGVGTGAGIVLLAGNAITMPSFTIQLVIMIGIGVGIDYALLIVTRYREQLLTADTPIDATAIAFATAGRSVVFAGTTVIISVLGLFVVGLDINRALGLAAAIGVATVMFATLTLLPAALGFVGTNIDRLSLPHRTRTDPNADVWKRWARFVQRHPVVPAVTAVTILVALTVPVASMRLGFGDASNRPDTDTTRRAYDLLAEGFGPGFNGPVFIAAHTNTPDTTTFAAIVDTVESIDGVNSVVAPIVNDTGTVALIQTIPDTAPQDAATAILIDTIRTRLEPLDSADIEIHVGGAQAAAVDFAEFSAERLPWFIATVLALSFVVLLVVFRSVLVAIKAVLLNLLSIGAAYGVTVAVFQWGWAAEQLGVGDPGPVEAWAPIMLFAIVFGLSMDYEVFLISRIKEHYDQHHDNATAVAEGLASTARVITAAAAIMVVVFAGFVLSTDRALQLFGLGLATAIFVDATIVRLVLVPATMELLGDRNWWIPAWLDRILPHVTIDAAPSTVRDEATYSNHPAHSDPP